MLMLMLLVVVMIVIEMVLMEAVRRVESTRVSVLVVQVAVRRGHVPPRALRRRRRNGRNSCQRLDATAATRRRRLAACRLVLVWWVQHALHGRGRNGCVAGAASVGQSLRQSINAVLAKTA